MDKWVTTFNPYVWASFVMVLENNGFEPILQTKDPESEAIKVIYGNKEYRMLLKAISTKDQWISLCHLFFTAVPKRATDLSIQGSQLSLQYLPREYGVYRSQMGHAGMFVQLAGQVFQSAVLWPPLVNFGIWDSPDGKGLIDLRAPWERESIPSADHAWNQFLVAAPDWRGIFGG